jgi:predicted phage gp36 major capsid-like protein
LFHPTPIEEIAMADPQAQFLDFYRSSLEAMLNMTRSSLDEAERLRTQQLEAIREALARNAELASEISTARAPRSCSRAGQVANHQPPLGYWGFVRYANRTSCRR